MTEARASRRGRRRGAAPPAMRDVNYRQLRHPFEPARIWSDDQVQAIHDAALCVLEDLGIRVLLPEAREILAKAGAIVRDDDMVFFGRDMVESALSTAPKSFVLRAGAPDRDIVMELGALAIQPGAGAPHATDLVRGRRPGTIRDFTEFVQMIEHFDALHMVPPVVEPQDVPPHLRHYEMTRAILANTDRFPFAFSRGRGQVMDCFEMIRDFRGLSDDGFRSESHVYTIVNTNSPRQIDIPMALGLIDFARHGQAVIVTPFTLMGAMAPITVAGALTLSHAEAMAAITLNQLANPGAPVTYGTFTSNVDMKSGAPAFGTPEQVRATIGAGQLARHLGLPWRCAAGSAANINDAQAAHETEISAWACMLAGSSIMIHGAGWLEGGLTVSYEKLITDMEMIQTFAELCVPTPAGEAEIGLDALREVAPGGHFFGAAHTMERYQTEFYPPLVHDWSNFGTWTERGEQDASTRATGIWQRILQDHTPPACCDADRLGALDSFIARRSAEGGAAPEG